MSLHNDGRAHFGTRNSDSWAWLGPLAYMIVVTVYVIARYGGQWAEADSATFAVIIRDFVREGRLVPSQGEIYPNGYTFQAISTYILAITGLDIGTLQQLVYPLLTSLVTLPAWLLYRELTGSRGGALVATVLLFTQPEFLFVMLRSSHEKFTRMLMLLSLYLLVRSFKLHNRPWLFGTYVGMFYLTAFAFIASNNLFAHSFLFTTVAALALGWLVEKRTAVLRRNRVVLKRLMYTALVSLGLLYIFAFFVYFPAQHDLYILRAIWDRMAALFLDVQETGGQNATNVYAHIATGWINLRVYLLVSIANWIVLAAASILWVRQGWKLLWQGQALGSEAAWLVWLFYAAFGVQGALSIVADSSGVLSGNIQHRLFPSVSIIAVAIVGSALAQWRPRRFAAPLKYLLTTGVFCIAILSVMKATNEPVLSNKWTFYRSSELAALEWSDAHLKNARIWTEYDERLVVAVDTVRGESNNNNGFAIGLVDQTTRSILLSKVIRYRSSRLGFPLPVPYDAHRVYDNGEAELYHLRPATPYQK